MIKELMNVVFVETLSKLLKRKTKVRNWQQKYFDKHKRVPESKSDL
jgi:hypothetical protein